MKKLRSVNLNDDPVLNMRKIQKLMNKPDLPTKIILSGRVLTAKDRDSLNNM